MSTPFPDSSSPKGEKEQKYYQMKKMNLDLSKKRFYSTGLLWLGSGTITTKWGSLQEGERLNRGLLLSDWP